MAKTSFFQGQNGYQAIDPDVVKSYRDQAQESAQASEVSAIASEQSATRAANSETNALAHRTAAASSATSASNSALAASGSAGTADGHRAAAATSATNAAARASEALTSRNNAANSASAAATSEGNALSHKNAAGISETNAASSASNALASRNAAATSETNAASSATTATTQATTATTKATEAANSATAANGSRTAAATSETNAASSASTALGHRNAAATSEANAGNSATAAASSASSALQSLNSFRQTYYGAFASDPSQDPLGGARTIGDLYYNTTIPALKVFNGSTWEVYNPLGASPAEAEYIVRTAHSGLSAARVLTNTPTVAWDYGTAGQVRATASTPDGSLTAAKLDVSTWAKQTDFRTTLGAISAEATAELGLLVNPFFEFSQESGTANVGNGGYPADQFRTTFSGTGLVISARNLSDPWSGVAGVRRLSSSVRATVSTAKASLAASDYVCPFEQVIEGINFNSLGWGTTDARSIDIVLFVAASVGGNYPISIRNGASNRSYVTSVAVASNTITPVFITVPGDTTGTWPSGNVASMRVSFGNTSGTTNRAGSQDTWLAGNFLTLASSTNWTGTSGANLTCAYMQAFPTGVLPFTSASQINGEALQKLLNIRRRTDNERMLCQRYWRQIGKALTGIWNSASACRFATQLTPPMRSTPAVTITTTSPTIEVWSSANVIGSSTYVSGVDKTDAHCLDVTLTGFSGAQGYRDPAFMTLDYLRLNARMT